MATLDDIRAAGYDVTLAWEGWDDGDEAVPDVYTVSREATQPDPTQPDHVGGSLSYVADDPQMIDEFLASHAGEPTPTAEQ